MEFSMLVKEQALKRSRGVCECRRETHKHFSLTRIITPRCTVNVDMHSKFRALDPFTDLNRAINTGGVSQCEVLCTSCYEDKDSHAA